MIADTVVICLILILIALPVVNSIYRRRTGRDITSFLEDRPDEHRTCSVCGARAAGAAPATRRTSSGWTVVDSHGGPSLCAPHRRRMEAILLEEIAAGHGRVAATVSDVEDRLAWLEMGALLARLSAEAADGERRIADGRAAPAPGRTMLAGRVER